MKLVDEFRDSDLIARARDEIRRLADPARQYLSLLETGLVTARGTAAVAP